MNSALDGVPEFQGQGLCIRARPRVRQVQVFEASGGVEHIAGIAGATPGACVGDVVGAEVCIFTIGPGRWLILSPEGSDLCSTLISSGVRAVDVSHARVTIRVSGVAALALLSRGCTLDFDLAAFPEGRCASSQVAQMACLIHRLPGEVGFDLYFARSYAQSASEWLIETGQAVIATSHKEDR